MDQRLSPDIRITRNPDLPAHFGTRIPDTPNPGIQMSEEHYFNVFFGSFLQSKIKNDIRFSMSLDEATSINLRRYISMILHTDTDIINLGLKRIHGTMPAEKCVELVIEKLKTFEINLDEHIVSVPSDAASVMCKFGRLIEKNPVKSLVLDHSIFFVLIMVFIFVLWMLPIK